ncbi:MAG: hypothetical protein IKM06_03665 [Clostridia bacterium]|nr:hypothetical protein [Clostridia bacterium]
MAYRIYPVSENDFSDYLVKINGTAVPLDVARVSRVPFNRRWPGHQRPLDQTELINFLSLSSSEPLEFEIIPKNKFDDVAIRPLEANIKAQISDGAIRFTLDRPQYFTVEPFGRNNALHIFVDPMEEKRDDLNEVIYFGKGEHFVDTIFLKSNQTVYIDEGAVVYGCIRAYDAENIKIIGRGILDNSKNKEEILFEVEDSPNDSAIKNATRKHTVQLEYCTNVEIEGITVRDSLVYNIRPIACKDLTIKNVKIIGNWRYNSDGIDMHNCENVLIENCFIRTFDDSICVKGFDCYYKGDVEEAVKKAMYRNGKAYDVFKNVRVKNCVIWNDWGKCLEIGAETRAEEIFDITFENCNIIHVSASVLDSFNIDYAVVHDVKYKDISVEYDAVIPELVLQRSDKDEYKSNDPDYAPDLISVVTAYHYEYSAGGTRRGRTENITFENIRLYSRQKPTFNFEGYDEAYKTKDILIKNIYWNGRLLKEISDVKVNQFVENIKYTWEE